MMYDWMPIDWQSLLTAKLLENVCHAELHELVQFCEKCPKKRHCGDDHPRRRDHVFAARPRDLLHLHANVMQEFTRVGDSARNFFRQLRACSALRFIAAHFHRPRSHKSSFQCALCASQTLAGEEGFEPPYPVLETGGLTVGRLP